MIEGVDPAEVDAFQSQLEAMFQEALDNGYPLVAPQNPVVNVPEEANEMTQGLGEQVAQSILDVQREATYLQWLMERM